MPWRVSQKRRGRMRLTGKRTRAVHRLRTTASEGSLMVARVGAPPGNRQARSQGIRRLLP
jgi:hypothetical protein